MRKCVGSIFGTLKSYAKKKESVECVLLVGSYARGTNREDSDIDVVLITSEKAALLEDPGFINAFGHVVKQQTEYYSACTSIRVWYEDGKEVEFGIVEQSWIAKLLDAGTARVLNDGYRLILDKKGFLNNSLKLRDGILLEQMIIYNLIFVIIRTVMFVKYLIFL